MMASNQLWIVSQRPWSSSLLFRRGGRTNMTPIFFILILVCWLTIVQAYYLEENPDGTVSLIEPENEDNSRLVTLQEAGILPGIMISEEVIVTEQSSGEIADRWGYTDVEDDNGRLQSLDEALAVGFEESDAALQDANVGSVSYFDLVWGSNSDETSTAISITPAQSGGSLSQGTSQVNLPETTSLNHLSSFFTVFGEVYGDTEPKPTQSPRGTRMLRGVSTAQSIN